MRRGIIIRIVVLVVLLIVLVLRGYTKDSENPESASPTSSVVQSGEVKSELLSVTKVIDGDTIEISTGQKVRYIGMDTPESTIQTECFGKEASEKNRQLIDGKKVRLEKDVSETDKFGRLLRYVYIQEDSSPEIFINEYLVKEGYANAVTYPPDVKYQEKLKEAEREARDNGRGLWSSCPVQEVKSASVSRTLDKDCKDFKTQAEAQQFFISQGGPANDPHKLDPDKDGKVCESLP